jgi:acyl-CoA synthetase (AMP-forming)/AMP-acid ligase II
LCPAYGMAELGLAATMTPLEEPWRARTLSTVALADNRVTVPEEGEPAVTLVASGPPLEGYEVGCGGEEGMAGPIAIRGPSIGVDGTTNTSYAGPDGWYTTDDAGFFSDGWLYVCGRVDDHIVAHGRNLYAPAIEAAVAEVDGVRAGRVAAVSLPSGVWTIVTELSGKEQLTTSEAGRLQWDIRRAAVGVATAQPDQIVFAPRGTLPLTSSGKLQRNEVRRRLMLGGFRDYDGPGLA